MGATLYITKSIEFAAAHRLYREEWSESDNFEAFGKCANPFGHGHNYRLEVTLKGEPDPQTGMILHYSKLKRILEECVIAPLDHHHLNHDVPFMQGVLPTSENLVTAIWSELDRAFLGYPFQLHQLRLKSTERNWVDYFG